MDEELIKPPELPPSKKRKFDTTGREDHAEDESDMATLSKHEQHQQRRRRQQQPTSYPPKSTATPTECSKASPLSETATIALSHEERARPGEEGGSGRLEGGGARGENCEEAALVFLAPGDAAGAASLSTASSEKTSPHLAKDDAAAAAGAEASGLPLSPPAEPSVATPSVSSERPLSSDDIRKFEEDGFVMLKRAFEPEVAAACRECLWKRLQGQGIRRDQPATWVRKQGIAEIYGTSTSTKKRRGRPWKEALSQRLKSAVDQLAGADKWEEFGCGWWMITFPGFAQPPWGPEGRWHVDGAHFRHYPHSREIGILPIFLFSDVRPQGGGTAVLRGSHKKVAEILWSQAGTTGLTGPELSGAARETLLPPAAEDVIETTGDAGDVLLTHPLLLHARSTNLAPAEESGVRFMCHPAIPLKRHMDLRAAPEAFTVLERVMWRAVHSGVENLGASAGANAGAGAVSVAGTEARVQPPVIHAPAQCDHSPVELRVASTKGRKIKAGGKKGQGKRGGAGQNQGTGTSVLQHRHGHEPRRLAAVGLRDTANEQQAGEQQGRKQHAAVTEEHGRPRVGVESPGLRDGPMEGGGGDKRAGGDAPPAKGSDDSTARLDTLDGTSASAERNGNEYNNVPAGASEALEEVDPAVLAAMGFGGFGGSRG